MWNQTKRRKQAKNNFNAKTETKNRNLGGLIKMDASKLKFDLKTVGVILLLASMWYDLKTDFAVHKEEHKLLEYRLAKLENEKLSAILPKKPKIENEDGNKGFTEF